MNYQINKYAAIKAALLADSNNNTELSSKMMKVIVRATQYELQQNRFSDVFLISKVEAKYFKDLATLVKNSNSVVSIQSAAKGRENVK